MGLISLDQTNNNNSRVKQYFENYSILIEELDEKYKNYTMEDFYNDNEISYENIPYIYGSHYSNPVYVCHY